MGPTVPLLSLLPESQASNQKDEFGEVRVPPLPLQLLLPLEEEAAGASVDRP